MIKRYSGLVYGVFAYLVSLLTIAWCIGFFGNLIVPRTIDGAAIVSFGDALLVNLGLIALFAVQHSGMARPRFKAWLGNLMPDYLERSTYILLSCVALLLLFVLWQPMGGVIWEHRAPIASTLIYALYFAGWVLMIVATFLLDHFELFGLRQAWEGFGGNRTKKPRFRTPGLYRHVRHPIYTGWLLILWCAPVMTVTHLVLAAAMTIYILCGVQLEERDLARELPEYEQYKRKVPMLLPSVRKRLLQEMD